MTGASGGPSEEVRAFAAAAWRFRWGIELEAVVRFERLASRLERLGFAPALADVARRASADEQRHAVHCARLAASLGGPVREAEPPPPPDVAPSGLDEEDALTYELTAACCVSETESVAVLTTLLPEARDPALRAALRELARDEVVHARLGWAQLAVASARGRTAFLGRHLPAMLRGTADDDLFGPVEAAREDPALLALGVLPHSTKRAIFVQSLEEVVFPGLEGAGVDTAAARAWMAERPGPGQGTSVIRTAAIAAPSGSGTRTARPGRNPSEV